MKNATDYVVEALFSATNESNRRMRSEFIRGAFYKCETTTNSLNRY